MFLLGWCLKTNKTSSAMGLPQLIRVISWEHASIWPARQEQILNGQARAKITGSNAWQSRSQCWALELNQEQCGHPIEFRACQDGSWGMQTTVSQEMEGQGAWFLQLCFSISRLLWVLEIFCVSIFTIVKTWKQPKCPSAEECIKKMWCNGILLNHEKE